MTKAVVQNKICAHVLVDMAFVYTTVRMIFCTKVEEVSDAIYSRPAEPGIRLERKSLGGPLVQLSRLHFEF